MVGFFTCGGKSMGKYSFSITFEDNKLRSYEIENSIREIVENFIANKNIGMENRNYDVSVKISELNEDYEE